MRRALAGLLAGLLTAAALCLAAPAGAAPFGVQLGPDRLMLDTPAGFFDSAGFGSPRLTDMAETLADATNRVLVFALSDADARRFASGDTLELRRYLLAFTPRATERERITQAQFAALVVEAGRNLGKAPEASDDLMKYLRGQPPLLPHLLAELRREPRVVSLMQGTMLTQPRKNWWSEEKPPLFKASTMTLVLIGGRAVYLTAFSAFDSPADLAWLKAITERWTDELLRLNK